MKKRLASAAIYVKNKEERIFDPLKIALLVNPIRLAIIFQVPPNFYCPADGHF